jgi:hypothetical protein
MSYIKNFRTFKLNESSGYNLPDDIRDQLYDDGEGNYLFYHYSSDQRSEIRPGTGQNTQRTSREEASALSSVGGLAMYFVSPEHGEQGLGSWRHIVKIPHNEVYYFNGDALNFYDSALDRFRERYPSLAFNPNYQVAWLTKAANENGFKMVVSKWRPGILRAQTGLTLIPYETKKDSR